MSDRELQIARAAVDAAATICNRQHHRMDLPGDYRYAAGICELHIRELDLPSIVAGVPPRHKAERVMDELNHHALDENQRLAARVAELTDKALRFDLDQAGIEAREREAVELVELRARVAELEKQLLDTTWQDHADHWQKRALKAEARVAELEQERLHTLTKHFEQIEEMTYRTDKVEADAKRYRWLRGGADIPPSSTRWARWEVRHWDGRFWETLFSERLDAAIDAAMREGKG